MLSTGKTTAILVLGESGVGKSTFINAVTGGTNMEVGGGLSSCTSEVKAVHMTRDGVDFAIVDTPGFNDTESKKDLEILTTIAEWLDLNRTTMVVIGVIYLHDISKCREDFGIFDIVREICGCGAYCLIVIGTTKREKTASIDLQKREDELKQVWGSHFTFPVFDVRLGSDGNLSTADALAIIDHIIANAKSKPTVAIPELYISKEMDAKRRNFIAHTMAGKRARQLDSTRFRPRDRHGKRKSSWKSFLDLLGNLGSILFGFVKT